MAEHLFDPTKSLRLQDIALWESELQRGPTQVHPTDGIRFQEMRAVRAEQAQAISPEVAEPVDLLRVLVTFGVRAMNEVSDDAAPSSDDDDPFLYALVSTFYADYIVVDSITQDHIEQFASKNAVHNMWPFWRQHVFDTLKKASLPVPEVPFFPGWS